MPAAAQTVADLAREVAPRTEAGRALAPELLDALHEEQIFWLGVPRALGGGERPPAETLAVAETIARGDASAGWCVAIAATSGLLGAIRRDARSDHLLNHGSPPRQDAEHAAV